MHGKERERERDREREREREGENDDFSYCFDRLVAIEIAIEEGLYVYVFLHKRGSADVL
jgi:hypothetical protein